MSTLNVENLKHENASSNNMVLDSDGSVAVGSRLTTTGGIGIKTDSPTRELEVIGNIKAGTGGSDTGLEIFYGSGSSDYGRIRFYENGVNTGVVHSFAEAWQGGNLSLSGGAVNLGSVNGVTLGIWNNPGLIVDNNRRVMMPGQPAFWAYNAGGTAQGSTGIVAFANTQVNVGNHYSAASASRFTAPVAGTYSFTGMLLHRTNGYNTSAEWTFLKNGSNISGRGHVYSNAAVASGHIPCYGSTMIYLNAGDYVQMYIHVIGSGTDYYTGERLAHFSGHLVG